MDDDIPYLERAWEDDGAIRSTVPARGPARCSQRPRHILIGQKARPAAKPAQPGSTSRYHASTSNASSVLHAPCSMLHAQRERERSCTYDDDWSRKKVIENKGARRASKQANKGVRSGRRRR